jgi:ketosteroid isomerase-like protein
MSPDNVDFVQRIYAEFGADWSNATAVADLERLADPQIRIDLSRRELNPAVYVGYEGMRRSAAEVREVWEDWRIEAERFEDAGDDRVLVIERYGGRGRESGVELQGRAAAIWTLRQGRVVGLEIGIPIDEAYAALGLTPPSPTSRTSR